MTEELCKNCKITINKLLSAMKGKSIHACANVCERFPLHCSTFDIAKCTYDSIKFDNVEPRKFESYEMREHREKGGDWDESKDDDRMD